MSNSVTPSIRIPGEAVGPIEKVRALLDGLPDGSVTLGDVVDTLGSAGTGLCLLLLSLTALVPGIAPIFGVALCAISLGLVLGHEEPLLPARIRRWTLDPNRLRAGLDRLAPRVAWLETWLRPRGDHLLRASGLRALGLASLINGILIVLPIPFGNTAPAIAMLLLSLGLVTGDGIAVAAGLVATAIALAIDAALVELGFTAIVSLAGSLF
jgi:hypothetical protein